MYVVTSRESGIYVFAAFMMSAFAVWVSNCSNVANTLKLFHLEYQDYGLRFITPDQYVRTYSFI
jgi:hypothetical protein